jgi:hypothetical protein
MTISRINEINSGNKGLTEDKFNSEKKLVINKNIFLIPSESFTHLNAITEGKPIFYLPPVNGTYDLFIKIAESIKRPVIGINWTLDCLKLNSVEETVDYFLVLINKTFPEMNLNFDFIGYSFGGFFAFELCIKLQNKWNRFPKLILLDSSPILLKFIYNQLSMLVPQHIGEETIFNSLLFSFLMDKVSIDFQNIESILQNTPKKDKIRKVSEIFVELSSLDYDIKQIEFAVESHVNKILMLIKHNINSIKFNGNLLLIRATEQVVNQSNDQQNLKHDYGLNEV